MVQLSSSDSHVPINDGLKWFKVHNVIVTVICWASLKLLTLASSDWTNILLVWPSFMYEICIPFGWSLLGQKVALTSTILITALGFFSDWAIESQRTVEEERKRVRGRFWKLKLSKITGLLKYFSMNFPSSWVNMNFLFWKFPFFFPFFNKYPSMNPLL